MNRVKLISMSSNTEFSGTNREDERGERPRWIVEYIPKGGTVSKSYNDGYYTVKSDEPHFILISTLGAGRITVSLSELTEAAMKYNMKLSISKSKAKYKELNPEDSYQKSISVGLSRFRPAPGHGRICGNCENISGNSDHPECMKIGSIILERFNDWCEYCHEVEHTLDDVINKPEI